MKEHNSNLPQIPDRSHRILIIGDFGSEKANVLVNQTIHQPDIDIVYLDDEDPNKREGVGLKHYNDSKVFIEYSNDKDDI